MTFLKKTLPFLAIVLCLWSCRDKRGPDVLVVATSADNPPYEFFEENKIVGFDIDLAEAIAKKLNRKLILKDMSFDSIIQALQSGDIDMSLAGFSPTEERRKKIDFSKLYFSSRIAILFNADKGYSSVENLKDKNVGVQSGTTWQEYAAKLSVKYGITLKTLPSNLSLIYELRNGNIDALILEEAQAKNFASNAGEKFPNMAFFLVNEESGYAAALEKNSAVYSLKEDIDKAIDELKSEGFIDALIKKWLSPVS